MTELKIEFGVAALDIVGHYIDAGGIYTHMVRVEAVIQFSRPSTARKLR